MQRRADYASGMTAALLLWLTCLGPLSMFMTFIKVAVMTPAEVDAVVTVLSSGCCAGATTMTWP